MRTQVRLLLQEQFDLGAHCLAKRLLKHFSRRQKQTTFVVIGALRVKFISSKLERLKICVAYRLDNSMTKRLDRVVVSAITR